MTKETWITAGTAAKILEERFGRPIRVDYVTRLGSLGRLRKQNIGSRIVLYNRHDVEQIQIKTRKKPSESAQESSVSEESTSGTIPLQGGSESHSEEVTEEKSEDPAA